MIKLLISMILLFTQLKGDCLTKDNLIKLGLTPLETP